MKIVLLGYMASGKSSIGKKLAKMLSMKFLDLDDYIIEKEGMSISKIFKDKGEIYFRKIENKYLKEALTKKEDFILALGGGTPCYGNNMDEVNKNETISIYLQGSNLTMTKRLIKKKAKRPLIVSGNKNTSTPEENAALIKGFNAHFGTYEVDDKYKRITFNIMHASFPNWENKTQKRNYTYSNNELKYIVTNTTQGGASVVAEVLWKKR